MTITEGDMSGDGEKKIVLQETNTSKLTCMLM